MKLRNLFFLLLSLSFFACEGPEYPEFVEMKNVKFKSVGFLNGVSVTCKADAVFRNPNPIGANVTEVNLDVMIDDKKVTTIKQEVSAEMPANADFVLPLDFDVPLKEVFPDLKSTLGSLLKTRKVNYHLVGTLKVGLGNVEVAVPIDYADEEEIRL